MANGLSRTPTIGLSYTSDATMNGNLDRIDQAFAQLLPPKEPELPIEEQNPVTEDEMAAREVKRAQAEARGDATPTEPADETWPPKKQ